jgi:hypothetical protein
LNAKSVVQFVTLRDHEGHRIPVLGGMWGGRGMPVPDMQRHIGMVCSVQFVAFFQDVSGHRH